MKSRACAFAAAILLLGGGPAAAHVKWFITPGQAATQTALPPPWWGWTVAAATLLAAVLACLVLERLSPPGDRSARGALWPKADRWAPLFLRLALATSLLSSAWQKTLISPDLELPAGLAGPALVVLQAAVALLLLADLPGLRTLTAWGLVSAFLAVLAVAPAARVAEHVDLLGFAAYFLLVGDRPTRGLPFGLLRTATGVALVALALNEKLANPGLSLAFLERYRWNFMPWLGFAGFRDDLFVMSAGAVEMLVGLFLVFGILPRLCGAAVLVLMTLTMALMGPDELVGHLPYMVVAFTLLVGEGGTRWRLGGSKPGREPHREEGGEPAIQP